jgi:hypothetical protein
VRITAGEANGHRAATAEEAGLPSLSAVVTRFEDKTRTVRYRPIGEQVDWLIGEPYIPYEVLEEVALDQTPERLYISLDWT